MDHGRYVSEQQGAPHSNKCSTRRGAICDIRRNTMNRNRLLVWTLGGALLIGAAGVAIVMAEPTNGPALIAGDQPVTEDQVRQKLQSDGWENVRIVRDGRYFDAIASKGGKDSKIVVDAQTGRLRAADDDDDD